MFGPDLDRLPGLRAASWRGVRFHVPDTDTEAGRRISATQFPGRDVTHFDDFGRHNGETKVNGLIAGRDYIERAEAFRAACEEPGSGTLVHPWRGEMTVVLAAPAKIKFAADELQVARLSVTFWQVRDDRAARSRPSGFDGAAASVLSAATALVGAALSPAPATVAQARAADLQSTEIAGAWSDAITADAPERTGDMLLGLARLAEAPSASADGAGAAVATRFAEALSTIATDLHAAARRKPKPAIGGR